MPQSESVVHGSALSPAALPALGRLLEHAEVMDLVQYHGHTLVAQASRKVLGDLRQRAKNGGLHPQDLTIDALLGAIKACIDDRLTSPLQAVYNLTGTVLHTNLGRACLADSAREALQQAASGPNTLEYDLEHGRRGDRDTLVETLLCELTGAEAATVVNNNAAAVLLTLSALAQGREVIVSRGELVEIGGSFRMPDVMAAAGVHMVEVGTTNRTHMRDYASAISAHSALLMKVHTSNYEVQGFTTSVDEARLAELAQEHGLALVSDLGSGSIIDIGRYGLPPEPLVQDKWKAGCDVVTFSGDKLLGGPQAGLIVGKRALIERIRRHPLKRALRMGQLPLAALEATLRLYLRPERLATELPTLRYLTRPYDEIFQLGKCLQPRVAQAVGPGVSVTVQATASQIGSGALPGKQLASVGLWLRFNPGHGAGQSLDRLARAWRHLPRPVIGRVHDDALVFDLRCLEDDSAFCKQLEHLPHLLLEHGVT